MLQSIGPLHDPVPWYKIAHAGTQVSWRDFQNKGRLQVAVSHSDCATCLPACLVLYHVTESCKRPVVFTVLLNLLRIPSTLGMRNLKTEVSIWRRIKCFLPHYGNLKTKQSPVVWDLCFRKTGPGQGNQMIIVTSSSGKSSCFKMFSVYKERKSGVFKFLRVFKSVFEKLRVRDGLV